MFKALRRALVLATLLTAVAAAAPAVEGTATLVAPGVADAHYTGTPYGNALKVANAYNGHCGNGTMWVCWAWPESWWADHTGAHSWYVRWTWREWYLGTLSGSNWRLCEVEGRVEHDAFVQIYTNEHCWWL
jgi:hypothetical protein